ncbi:hypothetical protein AAMO2058_000035800 [Amorphochlora amoebiformis]
MYLYSHISFDSRNPPFKQRMTRLKKKKKTKKNEESARKGEKPSYLTFTLEDFDQAVRRTWACIQRVPNTKKRGKEL